MGDYYYPDIALEAEKELAEIERKISSLGKYAKQQQLITETEQPTQIFLRKISTLIDVGKVNLISRTAIACKKPKNLIGYSDDDNFYFEPDEAFTAVIKACNDSGEHFPLTQT